MVRLASDADVHGDIIRGLRNRLPVIDMVRAQDALPKDTPDTGVLARAASENRILIANDWNTMVSSTCQRASRRPVPGLIATTNEQSIGSTIDDILLIAGFMPGEEIRAKSPSSCLTGDNVEAAKVTGRGLSGGRAVPVVRRWRLGRRSW